MTRTPMQKMKKRITREYQAIASEVPVQIKCAILGCGLQQLQDLDETKYDANFIENIQVMFNLMNDIHAHFSRLDFKAWRYAIQHQEELQWQLKKS